MHEKRPPTPQNMTPSGFRKSLVQSFVPAFLLFLHAIKVGPLFILINIKEVLTNRQ